MNVELEAQKAIFMKAYLQINNKNILDRFEELLLEIRKEELEKELFQPLTKEDLEKRALKAEEDYKNGHLTSLEDLMKEEW